MDLQATRRSATKVACRVLALLGVVGLAHDRARATSWIVEHRIDRHFSDDELAFYASTEVDESQIIDFSWRVEAIVSLIWALKGLSEMPALNEQFDVYGNVFVRRALADPISFIATAALRGRDELDVMESYLYHQHWRVRDRDLGYNTDQPKPDDPNIEILDTSIVTERRYGMSWVCGHGETWDDVSLDT